MDKNSFFQTFPNMPPELSGTLPRRIRLLANSRFMLIVLALILGLTVIAGFWFCKHVVQQMQQRSALRQDGAEVQGEITFLKRVGRGANIVRYTFTANGETASGKAEVPPELMRALRESKFITVRFLPSNPAINHPAAWEWSLLSNWPAIFVLLVYMPFGVFPIRMYRQRQLPCLGDASSRRCNKMRSCQQEFIFAEMRISHGNLDACWRKRLYQSSPGNRRGNLDSLSTAESWPKSSLSLARLQCGMILSSGGM